MRKIFNNLYDWLVNHTLYKNSYKYSSDSVIIACYFNFKKNPYRKLVFDIWYDSIKHLNHRIIECVLEGEEPELNEGQTYKHVYTEDVLWHKETLLNMVIADLPKKYKYVYWSDTDVLLLNKNWMVEGSKILKECKLLQPFSSSKHLTKEETDNIDKILKHPDLGRDILLKSISTSTLAKLKGKVVDSAYLPSFSYNYNIFKKDCNSTNYSEHGHVGFIWGARRDVLDKVGLYEKALVGGGDHIMAHCATGEFKHKCISNLFDETLDIIEDWGTKFHSEVNGSIGFVNSSLIHLWHGSIDERRYVKRNQDFGKNLNKIDEKKDGLYIKPKGVSTYVDEYFDDREDINRYERTRSDDSIYNTVLQTAGPSLLMAMAASALNDDTTYNNAIDNVSEVFDNTDGVDGIISEDKNIIS